MCCYVLQSGQQLRVATGLEGNLCISNIYPPTQRHLQLILDK